MSEEIDRNVYANAKPARPGWANALIVALVIFLAAVVMTFTSGLTTPTLLMWGGVLVSLVVAGIKALMALGR